MQCYQYLLKKSFEKKRVDSTRHITGDGVKTVLRVYNENNDMNYRAKIRSSNNKNGSNTTGENDRQHITS